MGPITRRHPEMRCALQWIGLIPTISALYSPLHAVQRRDSVPVLVRVEDRTRVGPRNRVVMRDARTGADREVYRSDGDIPFQVALSPDGDRVAFESWAKADCTESVASETTPGVAARPSWQSSRAWSGKRLGPWPKACTWSMSKPELSSLLRAFRARCRSPGRRSTVRCISSAPPRPKPAGSRVIQRQRCIATMSRVVACLAQRTEASSSPPTATITSMFGGLRIPVFIEKEPRAPEPKPGRQPDRFQLTDRHAPLVYPDRWNVEVDAETGRVIDRFQGDIHARWKTNAPTVPVERRSGVELVRPRRP